MTIVPNPKLETKLPIEIRTIRHQTLPCTGIHSSFELCIGKIDRGIFKNSYELRTISNKKGCPKRLF
jgi:hypothetical protein